MCRLLEEFDDSFGFLDWLHKVYELQECKHRVRIHNYLRKKGDLADVLAKRVHSVTAVRQYDHPAKLFMDKLATESGIASVIRTNAQKAGGANPKHNLIFIRTFAAQCN